MDSIKGKCTLITGAATGIGRATAILLAKQGANVIVSDYNEEEGKKTVALIKEENGTAKFVHCDVSVQEQVVHLVQEAVAAFGPVKLAVNNAGIGGALCPIHEVNINVWNRVLGVNLSGVLFCMQEELKVMLANGGGGSIVNIASLAGISGTPLMSDYGVSKHGVVSLTKSGAIEYGKYNIRVNAVCPSWVETPILNGLDRGFLDHQVKNFVPLKRIGQPEEVAQTILWLLSDKSSYINGHCLNVDGGMKAR
jgi:NAD(P)-dependent dehydrogenase (short-subunit alcohol dehydrogenase family)